MAHFASKEGVWSLVTGGRSETPLLEVPGLRPGQIVKVTANFFARTSTNDASEGFYFGLGTANPADAAALTPAVGLFQGDEGWKSCTLIVLFEITGTGEVEADFELTFSKGDLNPRAELSNVTLIAEVIA
jgi:hypothetical protein